MRIKIVAIILGLVLAASLCACNNGASGNTTEPSSQSPSSTASATDDTAGQTENAPATEITIEITPPEGWEPVDGSVLAVQYMKNTASFMVKDESYTSSTLDGVVDEALGIFQSSFDKLEVQGEAENITVDGKDAIKVTFTCVISSMNMKYEYVFLFAGGKTYTIVFGDLTDTFDSLAEDYNTIVNTIKFIEK